VQRKKRQLSVTTILIQLHQVSFKIVLLGLASSMRRGKDASFSVIEVFVPLDLTPKL